MIEEVAKEVWNTERECGLTQNEAIGNKENLNFDLVPVVYEWARGKVSSVCLKAYILHLQRN